MDDRVVIWGCIIVGAILLVCIVRLYSMINRINSSIAKLSYVIREDAKEYFEEAANKIVNTNEQFQAGYVKIISDGTKSALSDAGTVMEETLVKAQNDAGQVILQARDEARHILDAARDEANTYTERALDQSATTIQWVMEQYINETFSVEQHQEVIRRLLDDYINENRK